ncbi:DUF2064 domain-containing protein [Flavobacteriaceae bacterium R38]|nr:DUF2064 domain-containing protein [Flavobacteriaceae bacterium R38]
MNRKTAILIFAQSAKEELKHKFIYKGKKLFSTLNAQTLATVKSTGIPYYLFTEEEQRGDSFAERFSNAISDVYDKGYDYVITIGNDSPQLKKTHLLESQKQLTKNNFVLGPTADGGFYLMGMSKDLFNKEILINLPWQTNRLNNSLIAYINTKQTTIITLSTLFDIDTVDDLKVIINHSNLFSSELKSLILKILNGRNDRKKWHALHVTFDNIYSFTSYNKGSPVSFS